MTREGGEARGIVRAIGALSQAAAFVAGVVLMALMLLTAVDVAGRYFLDAPLEGVFDLTHFAVLIMVYFGLAYCGFRDDHVTIELVYDRLPAAVRRWLDRLTNLAGSVLFAAIAWRMVVQSIDVRLFGEASQLLGVPLFPFYWIASAGAALFAAVLALRIFVPRPAGLPDGGEEGR